MRNLLDKKLSTFSIKTTGKTYRAMGWSIALVVYVVSGVFCGYGLSNAQMGAEDVLLKNTTVEAVAYTEPEVLNGKESAAVSNMVLPRYHKTDEASDEYSDLLADIDLPPCVPGNEDTAGQIGVLLAGATELDRVYEDEEDTEEGGGDIVLVKASEDETLRTASPDDLMRPAAVQQVSPSPKTAEALQTSVEKVEKIGLERQEETLSLAAAEQARDAEAETSAQPEQRAEELWDEDAEEPANTETDDAADSLPDAGQTAEAGIEESLVSEEPAVPEVKEPEQSKEATEPPSADVSDVDPETEPGETVSDSVLTNEAYDQVTASMTGTVSGDSIAMPAPEQIPHAAEEQQAPKPAEEQPLSVQYSPDFEALCRIVQAEAGGEDIMGKILVANVVLNRVASPHYPNSISAVVFQSGQFSPIRDGSYNRASITQGTIEAVQRALSGENYAQGALYFNSGSRLNRTMVLQHGGHRFYI